MTTQTPNTAGSEGYGINEWLVDELYAQYKQDKNLVDPQWWDYFADYERNGGTGGSATTGQIPTVPGAQEARPMARERSSARASERADGPRPPAPSPPPDPDSPSPASAGAPHAAQVPTAYEAPLMNAIPSARDVPPPKVPELDAEEPAVTEKLRGMSARLVANMDESLTVPTATSVRAIPAKALIDNRIVINSNLARARGGKVSFTHIIGYAIVEALSMMPEMNAGFVSIDGKPGVRRPGAVNLGIAIDLPRDDGTRKLVVPSVKQADRLSFAEFWASYEDVVKRARADKLTLEDYQGTTISLTNPGTIGTVHSVPRLMVGQGAIIGVGAMEYPAEFAGASDRTLAELGVSKVVTLTSTYDHRIIQGAQSGDFLRLLQKKLLGEDGFYDRVFRSLRIPYEPVRWVTDKTFSKQDEVNKTARVVELIHAYRERGHLMADTDPLEYRQRKHPDLDVQTHGLSLWDLDREFPTGGFGGAPMMKLRHILGVLRDSYCRTTGIEYMHIQDPEQRAWIQQRVERPYIRVKREDQLRILRRLNAAEAFETFLQTKFVGQKRFSLEGGETIIALLDALLSKAAESGLDEVCIGMPHRGRLNVLANIAGKSYGQIFREFEGAQDARSVQGSGDVKYHLGTEGTFTAESGASTQVYLAANPSHLEAVDSVLEGIVRAKQDRLNRAGESFPVLPVLLHGDAAFAGQGIVAETLNLSQLRGYRTGGTVHIVVNNQVGFTTAPASSRSSYYCTDVAKMVQAPIFHVNGDDPEACVRVAQLAFDFRQEFDKDVVIDMVCYRRRGHNEGDDPSMTQPQMYTLIEGKRSVRKIYTESLIGRGDITVDEAEAALKDYQTQLERVFAETRESMSNPDQEGLDVPSAQKQAASMDLERRQTAVTPEVIKRIGDAHVSPPNTFTVHPKLRAVLDKRSAMSRDGGIDWATGEIFAFGSLLMEGVPVRLTGQDSRRGTFVQRHAVLIDRRGADEWTPLLYLSKDQARFWVYDSMLSEYAALGFEYGYSVERPDALVLWEAQFGDFANGAQTILDEFISSSEQKWGQNSSVTLLLPHGYEGQGPDHSSARIERYLQLAAENNLTVAMPSNPASYFHLLRRQAYARPRRPLVVFTPKSMLRNKQAVSPVEEFTTGEFVPVLPDTTVDPSKVRRVLACAGKVYWDLVAERTKRQDETTAIIRAEQFYPLDVDSWRRAREPFGDVPLTWVQEEPANQGAWGYLLLTLAPIIGELNVVSRPSSASPSTGSSKAHAAQQAKLVQDAFDA
ncbi:MAG: multifunctional oxoglutarate decarboxylase/oxoglutarate dehydrogenase thiamine pyrophosphate-binding subunit/dihydrolipoyllysine-residue succinyltransferase subunit [Actinomycetales bacterium]